MPTSNGAADHANSHIGRRRVLQGMAVGAAAVAGSGTVAIPRAGAEPSGLLVGAGRADVTGVIAGQGMMGYSDLEQVASGLLQRIWARAYIVVDIARGTRVAFVNADLALIFESHRVGVLAELRSRFGDMYTTANVNLNATHNHNSCGGTSWDYAHTVAAMGHRRNSYRAEVDGIVEAIVAAHDSLGPGTLELGHSELHDASANRSQLAFVRNPAADRDHFPNAIDPQVTSLRLRRAGHTIGEITWFATHGTSMTDANKRISTDNKGFAAYLAELSDPGVISAFPNTNAGDMTPNLWVRKLNPGGPTDDRRANTAIIGQRQYDAGRRALSATTAVTGRVESAHRFIDFSDVRIDGRYTPDGRPARTTPAIMGAAAAATSTEDNTRSQLPFLSEGMTLPFADALGADTGVAVPEWVQALQAPKLPLLPLGYLPPHPWVQQVLPIQLIRIGDLLLCAGPGEFTITAALRIRRLMAEIFEIPLENVLMQGYSNGYHHYITTPEEYLAQQYEGGQTLFGRYTLLAYLQEFSRLAHDMRSGRSYGRGPQPVDHSGPQPDLLPAVPADSPGPGRRFGDVLSGPREQYRDGDTVTVSFCGAHPANRVRRAPDRYFVIERFEDAQWRTAYDDNHWDTELAWRRADDDPSASVVTVSWYLRRSAVGRYRIRYFGDAKRTDGGLTSFTAVSAGFSVG